MCMDVMYRVYGPPLYLRFSFSFGESIGVDNNRDGGVRGNDGEGGDAGDGARRTSRKRPLHLRPQEEGDTGTLVQGVL